MRLPAPPADAALYPLLRSCAGWGVAWVAEHDGDQWRFWPVLPEWDAESQQGWREWSEAKRVGLRRELLEWVKAQKKPLREQGQTQHIRGY